MSVNETVDKKLSFDDATSRARKLLAIGVNVIPSELISLQKYKVLVLPPMLLICIAMFPEMPPMSRPLVFCIAPSEARNANL